MKTEDLKYFIKVPDDYVHDSEPVIDFIKQLTILYSRAAVALSSVKLSMPSRNYPDGKLYYLDY
jgi:hypothetical protein